MADEVDVEFLAYSAIQPDEPVEVKIVVTYPDNEVDEFETGEDGRAVRSLKSCDFRVKIEAKSHWGDHTRTSTTCDPVPVKLAMVPTVQAEVVGAILTTVASGQVPSDAKPVQEYFEALRNAVEADDVSAAARAANELQWSLYVAGETQEAYNYGVFAQSAGFEALNASEFAAGSTTWGPIFCGR